MRREPKQAGELPKHVQEKRLPTPFLVIRMGFALEQGAALYFGGRGTPLIVWGYTLACQLFSSTETG